MAKDNEPVILELAALPRDQIGPFIVLGLDKDAGKEQIEANWARRVIWARKNQFRIPLEDVNWAREAINDPERRPRSDAASLNLDTAEGTLRRLAEHYGVTSEGASGQAWQPLDSEKDLRDYVPEVEVPDPETIRSAIALPEVPQEVPAVGRLLEQVVQTPLDPWAADLLVSTSGTAPRPDGR